MTPIIVRNLDFFFFSQELLKFEKHGQPVMYGCWDAVVNRKEDVERCWRWVENTTFWWSHFYSAHWASLWYGDSPMVLPRLLASQWYRAMACSRSWAQHRISWQLTRLLLVMMTTILHGVSDTVRFRYTVYFWSISRICSWIHLYILWQ